MRWLRSRTGRVFAFVLALVVALVAVYAVGAIKDNSSSSSSSSTLTSTAKGAEEANGPASFIGHASNAVVFIQSTRSGRSVTGSLREAISKRGTLSLESADRAFTGVIAGKGITLNLSGALGESSTYVGEVKESGFTLTVPGQGSNLISVRFAPGEVSGYDEATKQLLLAKYPSPCSLYVVGHEVRVSFTGAPTQWKPARASCSTPGATRNGRQRRSRALNPALSSVKLRTRRVKRPSSRTTAGRRMGKKPATSSQAKAGAEPRTV